MYAIISRANMTIKPEKMEHGKCCTYSPFLHFVSMMLEKGDANP
jgi:hypothetical protein